jgi:hypothetical protein
LFEVVVTVAIDEADETAGGTLFVS